MADDLGDEIDSVDEGAETSGAIPELPSVVGTPTVALPAGCRYGVTRDADLILREAFPDRFAQLVATLDGYSIHVDELTKGGGGRASQTIADHAVRRHP